jgi:hypothetical protein
MKRKFVLSLCAILFLSACSMLDFIRPAQPDIQQTLDAARTEAVETALEEIVETETLTPLPATLTATLTATSTFTQTLTQTPTPTYTITPSHTATAVPPTHTATFTPSLTATAIQPSLTVLAVDHNRAVTLEAQNFPKNTEFYIRIGSASKFYVNYTVAGTIKTGSTGTFTFTILLPVEVQNTDRITVRLDSEKGDFAETTFTNSSKGSIAYDVPVKSSQLCEFTVTPAESKIFAKREDFDAAWTIKNTGSASWDQYQVDYDFIGGEKMQKYQAVYDLPSTVQPGESIKIVVDMLAPDKTGTYTTHWGLVIGQSVICHLPLQITVK